MNSQGKVIKGDRGGLERFLFSLVMQEGILAPEEYILVLDPAWNKTSVKDFKKVLIDIVAPCKVLLEPCEFSRGMHCLETSLALEAEERGDRKYYLEKTNYGCQVWRVSNIALTKAWYGVSHTKNESAKQLSEVLNPKLKGIEIVNKKPGPTGKFPIELSPGASYTLVFRQTEMACDASFTYAIKQQATVAKGDPFGNSMMVKASVKQSGIASAYADLI